MNSRGLPLTRELANRFPSSGPHVDNLEAHSPALMHDAPGALTCPYANHLNNAHLISFHSFPCSLCPVSTLLSP